MNKYILLFLLSFNVMATEAHHVNVINAETKGVALNLATAQHHFDFGTHEWQGSLGAGYFDDETAISFGLGKRFDRVLINGSVGVEGNEVGFGAGVNWRF